MNHLRPALALAMVEVVGICSVHRVHTLYTNVQMYVDIHRLGYSIQTAAVSQSVSHWPVARSTHGEHRPTSEYVRSLGGHEVPGGAPPIRPRARAPA